MQSRIKAAIEFLKEKKSFSVGDLRLGVDESGDIEAIGWSQYGIFENRTKAIALKELAEIKQSYFEMLDSSAELKSFMTGKRISFHL